MLLHTYSSLVILFPWSSHILSAFVIALSRFTHLSVLSCLANSSHFFASNSFEPLDRVKSFAKRLLQISAIHQPPFACGVLYMIHELGKAFPALDSMVDGAEAEESDDEETFRDVEEDADAAPVQSGSAKQDAAKSSFSRTKYDPQKRDPTYACAKFAPLWELNPMLRYYHPSVGLFSQRLLSHERRR